MEHMHIKMRQATRGVVESAQLEILVMSMDKAWLFA